MVGIIYRQIQLSADAVLLGFTTKRTLITMASKLFVEEMPGNWFRLDTRVREHESDSKGKVIQETRQPGLSENHKYNRAPKKQKMLPFIWMIDETEKAEEKTMSSLHSEQPKEDGLSGQEWGDETESFLPVIKDSWVRGETC